MSDLTVRAPAKINLHLGVGAPREDGFHPLETVYQAVGLCDDLTITRADDWSVSLEPASYVDPATVPLDGDNIVDLAVRMLAELKGVPVRGHLRITKNIPVAGGMAGGSADAAAALVAFDRLWKLRTSDKDMLRLGAELGSDVPFALVGGNKLGTGRGELLQDIDVSPRKLHELTWWWVIVPSDRGLSTPEVYRHFDRLFPDAPARPKSARRMMAGLAVADPKLMYLALHNDLQPAAIDLRPDLGVLLERGEAEGAVKGLVSGSGPTCVFLCESADNARTVAGALQAHGHPVVLVANGPVAGAHVVKHG
jgi:4-diphosphocytidyl-2-C-methyl-D-erythritol kinase